MGKKTGWGVKWGVKWDVVKIGARLFFPAGIPAAIMYYGYDRIYLALVVVSFTGLFAMIWGGDGRSTRVASSMSIPVSS